MSANFDGTQKEFFVHTASQDIKTFPDKVTIKNKESVPITRKYQDVKKNAVKFVGKITVETENEGIRKNLTMFITNQEDIKLLIGMDWLPQFNWTIQNIENTTTTTNQSEKDKIVKNIETFFRTNGTIKDTEIKIQVKSERLPIEQTARQIQIFYKFTLKKK